MLVDTTFIYALTGPGTRTIRYFGKADDPIGRRTVHIKTAKAGKKWHVYHWIRKLLKAGQRPDVHVLCEVPQDDFERFERAFIALGRQAGFDLTNGTDGGQGPSGRKLSPEDKAKLSAANSGEKSPFFGKKRPQEFCDKISAATQGEKNPMFGKAHPPELIAKIAAKNTGKKRTPKQCAELAARKKKSGTSSSFYGVGWDSRRGKWRAKMKISGKEIYLGRFENEIEAARAHDTAAKKYHGEFAKLNFP